MAEKKSGCENPTCTSCQTIYDGFCYECSTTTMENEVKRQRVEKWRKMDENKKWFEDKIKSGGCRDVTCLKKVTCPYNWDYCTDCYNEKKCKENYCRSLATKCSEFCFECKLGQTKSGRKIGAQLQRADL